MKKLTLIVFLSCSFATPVSWSADFNKGVTAYQAGNYKAALAEWRPLAHAGNARAQNFLGFMYDNGEGVLEDDLEAVKWYRLAAEQGNPKAQYGLGVMFANGEGVTQSNVYAHMWWNIAASNGDRQANENKAVIASQMSAQELSNAQSLARACVSKSYKNCYKKRSSTKTKKST
ncbi:MAG: sel1 repeat family protein [Gammaproteobacteria bacterium]|mgnify:FL=1|nr:sel1 repeat family protein [Gammaproteobacteria bacterium]